jgi:class 3 adenylate cyclase
MFEGDDYIGRSVNMASRLCDRAKEGKVLATADGTEV